MKAPPIPMARCRQKPRHFERPPFIVSGRLALRSQALHADFGTFTAEEHLEVQRQIEQRARELWCQRGGQPDRALADWLQAEEEVVIGFIRIRMCWDALQSPISFSQPSKRISDRRK